MEGKSTQSALEGESSPEDTVSSERPKSLSDVIPKRVRSLASRADFYPPALRALARLDAYQAAQIERQAKREVRALPTPMRSWYAFVSRYISLALCVPPDTLAEEAFGTEILVAGTGIRTTLVRLADAGRARRAETVDSRSVKNAMERMARQELRQLLAPRFYSRPPYCQPELFHVENHYDDLDPRAIQEWVDARAKVLHELLRARLKAKVLADRRSLGAIEFVPAPVECVTGLNHRAFWQSPDVIARLQAMYARAPLLLQVAVRGCEPSGLAERVAIAEEAASKYGGLVTRHLDKPFPSSGNLGHEAAIAIRVAMVKVGSGLSNTWTQRGQRNLGSVFGVWLSIPGANEVLISPEFDPVALAGAMKDFEDVRYEQLANGMRDAIDWCRLAFPQRERAPVMAALLAMSFSQLHSFTADAHEQMRRLERDTAPKPSRGGRTLVNFMSPCEVDGFKMFELVSRHELQAEGQAMAHCVATYYRLVQSRRARIVSVRNAVGQRVATCEVCKAGDNYYVAQLTAYGNACPSAEVLSAAHKLVEWINKGVIPVNKEALVGPRSLPRAQPGRRRPAAPQPVLGRDWVNARLARWIGRLPVALKRKHTPHADATNNPAIAAQDS